MLNIIESKDNPKIKNAVKLAKDAKLRSENGVFFASTPKVVMDVLAAGFKAESLFFTKTEYEKYAAKLDGQPVFIISEGVSAKLSEDKTSQGVFGIFRMKTADTDRIFAAEKLIILEDIQDPGNMGAIMRTALAFGYEDIVVSAKCADIYSPKVLRSSMTASVKLNVCRSEDIPALVKQLGEKGFSTVATCLENSRELGSEKISLPVAVLIGNEGNGLSAGTIAASTHKVKIPMSDKIESLNAAVSAGVMMWELRGE
ncbi:MAG: RNA methyltransferase [Oscillospiraceae bacterium]|nr:RNA methyltransferase [Oscillospiraceae bacterium]